MSKTVAFFPRSAQRRGASIVRHTEGHKAEPFEVIYELPERGQRGELQLSWRFFRTRREADSFVSEVR